MNEAIILAGGLGTRLRSEIPDLPKCMAPVAGRPFIAYVIDYLLTQGIERFIFSLGYKHEAITDFLTTGYPDLTYDTVVEPEPLGTGGAIRAACAKTSERTVLVVNGDTLFEVRARKLGKFHGKKNAEVTLCLKPMENVDRYGLVDIGEEADVLSFQEKKASRQGLINGGVYVLTVATFLSNAIPAPFSFEKDYLEPRAGTGTLYGWVEDAYFIDIGIPDDYNKAQTDFS